MDAEPIYQPKSVPERPAIHVAVLPDADPIAFRWVAIGAEEEGVPCREVLPPRGEALARPAPGEPGSAAYGSAASGGDDPLAAAYAAAQGSRLGVGIAVGNGRVYLHEAHMPAEHPVWQIPLGGDLRRACRLAGCNAGRLVKRMPLRFDWEDTPVAAAGAGALGAKEGGARAAASGPEACSALVGPGPQPPATLLRAEASASQEAPPEQIAAIIASIVRALQGRGIV